MIHVRYEDNTYSNLIFLFKLGTATNVSKQLQLRKRIIERKLLLLQKRKNLYQARVPNYALRYLESSIYNNVRHIYQHYKLTLKAHLNHHDLRRKVFNYTTQFLLAYYEYEILNNTLAEVENYINLILDNELILPRSADNFELTDVENPLPQTNQFLEGVENFDTPNTIQRATILGSDCIVVCLSTDDIDVRYLIDSKRKNDQYNLQKVLYQQEYDGRIYNAYEEALGSISLLSPIEDEETNVNQQYWNPFIRKFDAFWGIFIKAKVDYIIGSFLQTHLFKPHKFMI